MNIIGNAIRPIYFQKAASLYPIEKNKLQDITKELLKYLVIIGIIPFSILTVYGDLIFKFLFGKQWEYAGLIAGILGYYYIFRLISSPISSVLWVIKKEKSFFIFQIFLFFTRFVSLFIGLFLIKDFLLSIVLFSIANVINYLVLIVYVLKKLEIEYKRIIIMVMSLVLGLTLFLYSIKKIIIIIL